MCKIKALQALYEKTKAYHGDVRNGSHCLYHVHEDDCTTNEWICADAARKGHYACLAYAHQVGCPMTSITIRYAALNGHLDCIEYACTNGVTVYSNACVHAALTGQLHCLKYLHTHLRNKSTSMHRPPYLDKRICEYAAHNGQLPCIIFAHENGYPLTDNACINALVRGHFDCFVYVYQHVRPAFELYNILSTTIHSILIGTSEKHLSTIRCLAYLLREHAHGRLEKDPTRAHMLSSNTEKEALAHAMSYRKRVCMLENAYIMYKVKKKIDIYKKELIAKAWHPARFEKWCLTEDEKDDLAQDFHAEL